MTRIRRSRTRSRLRRPRQGRESALYRCLQLQWIPPRRGPRDQSKKQPHKLCLAPAALQSRGAREVRDRSASGRAEVPARRNSLLLARRRLPNWQIPQQAGRRKGCARRHGAEIYERQRIRRDCGAEYGRQCQRLNPSARSPRLAHLSAWRHRSHRQRDQ
jgi:hypothetical protein